MWFGEFNLLNYYSSNTFLFHNNSSSSSFFFFFFFSFSLLVFIKLCMICELSYVKERKRVTLYCISFQVHRLVVRVWTLPTNNIINHPLKSSILFYASNSFLYLHHFIIYLFTHYNYFFILNISPVCNIMKFIFVCIL